MPKMFEVDAAQLWELIRFYKTSPRLFAKATGSMLNDFAFGARNTAIEVIREKMTTRNPRFIETRLRVDKSHTREPMESQAAELGSVATKRFSGWVEQQTGKRTTRERTINLLARGKTQKKKLKRPFRMNQAHLFESFHDYPGRGPEARNIQMLQRLDRHRWQRPFIVVGKKGMKPGLYKFVRRKPRLLQIFDSKNVQPKKIPWLTMAVDRYFAREDIRRLWKSKMDRMLKR